MSGWYLEMDYQVQCAYASENMSRPTERYARYRPFVIGFGMVYALGIPAFYLYLVERYRSHGEDGDAVVDKVGRPLVALYRPVVTL